MKEKAESLLQRIDALPAEQFTSAVDREAMARTQAFQDGVKAYHENPYHREDEIDTPPPVWQKGDTRLLDYGSTEKSAPPLLVVPSLINKAYVLDLSTRRSFMRAMEQKGFHPFLMDWGTPENEEGELGLEDYILDRLATCLDHVISACGREPVLIGYCMGGILTTALAERHPDKIRAMVLMATPWDYHAHHEAQRRWIAASRLQLELILESTKLLPTDVIQTLFASLDPYSILRKFQNFANLPPTSAAAKHFIALEDWLNDGIPMSALVARTCLFGWYLNNDTAKLNWILDDQPVEPANVECPCLVLIPKTDRIVPPESARALAQALPNAEVWDVEAGHIGMVVGGKATSQLYTPLAKWLKKIFKVVNR